LGGRVSATLPPMLTVSRATEVNDELHAAVARLLPQLSRSGQPPSLTELGEIVGSPATILFLARDDDKRIVGMLTLALFRIPTAVRAWIEDVVVDDAVRGQGGGEALTRAALDAAAAAGAKTVELTSRPSREAANRLYQRMGFAPRETNVYRYELDQA
jgi:ribosomal protein S18 acetylase RimI-like enzyme